MSGFHGNFGVLVRAYTYIRSMGNTGLTEVSGNAVLNANYLLQGLRGTYHVPYDRRCMHEVVVSARDQKAKGARGLDIAKRLLDYGVHAPTTYFPLLVPECFLIEPTETESKEEIDAFVAAMANVLAEAAANPELVKSAPHSLPAKRLDDVEAARRLNLRWRPER